MALDRLGKWWRNDKNIAVLASNGKRVFLIRRFWTLLPLQPLGRAQKFCQTQKYSTRFFLVRAFPLSVPWGVLLQCHGKTVWTAFPKKIVFLTRFEFTPLPFGRAWLTFIWNHGFSEKLSFVLLSQEASNKMAARS